MIRFFAGSKTHFRIGERFGFRVAVTLDVACPTEPVIGKFRLFALGFVQRADFDVCHFSVLNLHLDASCKDVIFSSI